MMGGISEVVENAAAMAARLDTTVKKTGTQKRDVDYIAEYASFVGEVEEARKKAEASGSAFDDAAFTAKFQAQMGVKEIDSEMDTFYASRKAKK
jgi:hypothetical protein